MAEHYPSDAELNALSGTTDPEQEVLFIRTGETPSFTSFYKMLYRLMDVARRAGDFRVYKDGDLTFGIRPGRLTDGDSVVEFGGATGQPLTDGVLNYIYLLPNGTIEVSTSSFPVPSVQPHLPLAKIATGAISQDSLAGQYGLADIEDFRGRG